MLKTILSETNKAGGIASGDALISSLSEIDDVISESISLTADMVFLMTEIDGENHMIAVSGKKDALSGFEGETIESDGLYGIKCPATHKNAVVLRGVLPRCAPTVLDCKKSFGMGDRIGGIAPATPGHIDAIGNSGMIPVLAQQSVRENLKTGRTFEEVMDDVTWAVFRTGFEGPWGSDADHLKTVEEAEDAVNAGFTMFTVDPSELIDNAADTYPGNDLRTKFDNMFSTPTEASQFIVRYMEYEGSHRESIARSGVKYLGAIRHGIKIYKRLVELLGEGNFNFELSIDETDTTTSSLDHRIIATELKDAGVKLFSLAPRFEGAFEKGIDYKGEIDYFISGLISHVNIAEEIGGYRLSLHSGSDKFSVYPLFAEITNDFFHVKTAGTSYLEAVKTMASEDFDFFKKIFTLSRDTFDENVKSYEISANPALVPDLTKVTPEAAVEAITENPDLRQMLHIAFGVVLKEYGAQLRHSLRDHSEQYREHLTQHLGKHVKLLSGDKNKQQ